MASTSIEALGMGQNNTNPTTIVMIVATPSDIV